MLRDEMQHTADVDLFERVKKGRIDGLGVARICECPAVLCTAALDLEVRICA
jgi:hypothetical protein